MSRTNVGLLACLTIVIVASPCLAAEPKLEELLATVPLLSSETGDLKGISLQGRLQVADGVVVNFEYAWARTGGCAVLVTLADVGQTPVMYCSQDRMMMVDYLSGVVAYHEKGTPKFRFRLNEKNNASMQFSISLRAAAVIVLDATTFLQPSALGRDGKWERQTGSTWRYTNVSNTGASRVIADFDREQAYPLKRFEIRDSENQSLKFLLENVRLDQPLPKRLQRFPEREQFPDGIVVTSTTFIDGDIVAAAMEWMEQVLTAVCATAAIDNRDLRDGVERFRNVDWDQAKINRDKYAPALRRMLDELAK